MQQLLHNVEHRWWKKYHAKANTMEFRRNHNLQGRVPPFSPISIGLVLAPSNLTVGMGGDSQP